jgi:GNAT superfamily N-acetyltransferase
MRTSAPKYLFAKSPPVWSAWPVDRDLVLASFDEQIRRDLRTGDPDTRVERDGDVIRCVSQRSGWGAITWSHLDAETADAVIAEQVNWFAPRSRQWEWKHYSYDTPPDLPRRLLAAGFVPDPVEALMIAEISDLSLEASPPSGVQLRPVVDEPGVATLVVVHDRVFGGDHSGTGQSLLSALTHRPHTVAAFVAVENGTPISSGRMEFHNGTEFASLWGGGTVPEWRGRGVFRALVARRAALAAEKGFRYLQVDASADSRPILERLGFVQLATTTPFIHQGNFQAMDS